MTYDPNAYYRSPHQPVPQPKPKRRVWPWVLGAMLGLCVCGAGAAAIRGGSEAGKPVAGKAADIARAVSSDSTTEPSPDGLGADADGNGVPDNAFTKDGITYLVPGDYDVAKTFDLGANRIKPGTYVVTSGGSCYWERVSSWDGDFDSIIANGNIDGSAKARVTVKKSDAGLHLGDGCMAGIKGGAK